MSKVFIYGLVDPRNNQIFYVGFTKYLNKRYNTHLNTNGKKREKNTYKENVINIILKLGLKPEMKVIDECDYIYNSDYNMYEHERLEIYYIKKYREEGIKLTNLTDGGDGGCTYQRKVYQYDENGKFLKEYQSVNEVADFYNVNIDLISKVIDQRGKNSYRGTYLFSSKENAINFKFKPTLKHETPIMQYTFDGIFVEKYNNQQDAAKAVGITQPTINKCLKGESEQAGGYLWYYVDKLPDKIIKYNGKHSKMFKQILQYDLNNNLINEYKSISEASRCLNIGSNLIVTNLKNKTKTCKGFIWKYK